MAAPNGHPSLRMAGWEPEDDFTLQDTKLLCGGSRVENNLFLLRPVNGVVFRFCLMPVSFAGNLSLLQIQQGGFAS